MNGQHPSAITTQGPAGADLGPPAMQAEQPAALVVQIDPVLTPFRRCATKSKSGQDCGWNRCVTRTRRSRSSGRGVADDAVRTRSPDVRSATPAANA